MGNRNNCCDIIQYRKGFCAYDSGSRIGSRFLIICLFDFCCFTCRTGASFLWCLIFGALFQREEDRREEEAGVPRLGGREVYKRELQERELIQWLELALFLPFCTEQYFYGCPDMVKLVGNGSCSA